jgi:hypothetical protein
MGRPRALATNRPLEGGQDDDMEWLGNYYWGAMTDVAIDWVIKAYNKQFPDFQATLISSHE